MITAHDPKHLETATRRFRQFFEELHQGFVERDNLLVQSALALLSRQHVLMTGPPGTAKSLMASMVLGRIIDESTGGPSLFARQFTENTVQTDLIGPINFKTLMESGRTEHFTDEGMLGSVHAFLDEVFDGRDMLLRSTLNLLHERELKQGGVVAKGRIECAFMTSNRYIADVLDTARETLLAFIDRISFISFVPRGFASPDSLATVVRRHGGGFGRHRPQAYLSVQDLDVLQAAADLTFVPEAICDAVAQLVTMLDAELAEAQRFDPKFQPTRYLSTRTAVQATQVLRAAVLYERIFQNPDQPLQVEHRHIEWLRFSLLLNGVARDSITARIAQENDPRERRQLDIMATEAEIFDRCFSKLPKVPKQPPRERIALGTLETMAQQARRSRDPNALEQAVKALVTATESGSPGADDAAGLLVDTMGTLFARALQGGLAPDLQSPGALNEHSQALTQVADALERATGSGRSLAQWLRGRLLRRLDDALSLAVSPTGETVELLAAAPSPDALGQQIAQRFEQAEAVLGLRRQLRAGGGGPIGFGAPDEPWDRALDKLETELTLLWDARFRLLATRSLAQARQMPLDQVLRSLESVLDHLRADTERFSGLGRRSELLRRVTGPRIEPLVASVFTRLDGHDRPAVMAQVEAVVAELRRAGLGAVITPERFVAWVLPALLRGDPGPGASPPAVRDREAYEQARAGEPSLSITVTLLRVAIAAQSPEQHADDPEQAAAAMWQTLRALPAEQHEQIVEHDLARASRGVGMLEAWWTALSGTTAQGIPRAVAVLEAVVHSGFLRAMRADGEPLRLAAEVDHVGEVFPGSHDRGTKLRHRLAALDARCTEAMVKLLESRADQAWSTAFDSQASS